MKPASSPLAAVGKGVVAGLGGTAVMTGYQLGLTVFTVADCGAGRLGLLGCVVCWKRRAILAGVSSSAAVALTAASIASGQGPRPAVLLVLDVIVLTIALTLLTLGQAIWRLLDDSFNQDS